MHAYIQRIGCQPPKNYSWSAEQGNENKNRKYGSPKTLLVRRKYKFYLRDAPTYTGATQIVSVRLAPVRDAFGSSTRPMLIMVVALQNPTLLCAIITFPVSLPLSSPGEV